MKENEKMARDVRSRDRDRGEGEDDASSRRLQRVVRLEVVLNESRTVSHIIDVPEEVANRIIAEIDDEATIAEVKNAKGPEVEVSSQTTIDTVDVIGATPDWPSEPNASGEARCNEHE